MKRILLFFTALSMALGLTSCQGDDYLVFVGTWGVDRIDYYNIDYAGQPIESTISTYYFTPGDPNDGIDLIFRNDRTGEMRDRSRDTLIFISDIIENDTIIDTIICPDTTIVTKFTYSYHDDDALLYMNMKVARPYTYMMHIEMLSDDSFIYVNEYDKDYVEKARLIRLSNEPAAKTTKSSKPARVPFKPKSLFGSY